jgi:RNA polymerase sigma factor (TIGR02999 family)
MSARLMRRVLVDAGRARGADKRGGDAVRVSLSEALGRSDDLGQDVVALHDALEQLDQVDARKARLVELRFFAGLSVEEAAVALEVSPQTAARDWTFAKAWAPEGARPAVDDAARRVRYGLAMSFCGRIGPPRSANRTQTVVSRS